MFQVHQNHLLMKIVHGTLISLPSPKNIHLWWTFGSLLSLCLMTQIATGLLLAMQFVAEPKLSFDLSLEISQIVNSGWTLRMIHTNGASFFFLGLYLHIGRGMFFNSFFFPHTWGVGVMIFLMVMGTAFLGYVLPWGQMSFWGATVITSLLTAIPIIGPDAAMWLWGGYSIDSPTLTRFFSLHFLLPFIILGASMAHLAFLHETGSSNPLGLNSNHLKIPLSPYFLLKDFVGFIMLFFILYSLITWAPWSLGDPENFIPANPLMAPIHIQPEWYFLYAYAILRSIPNKLGGVIALVMSVVILFLPIIFKKSTIKGASFLPSMEILFWVLVNVVLLLTWIGACPVEPPFVSIGQVLSVLYFSYFLSYPLTSHFSCKLLL